MSPPPDSPPKLDTFTRSTLTQAGLAPDIGMTGVTSVAGFRWVRGSRRRRYLSALRGHRRRRSGTARSGECQMKTGGRGLAVGISASATTPNGRHSSGNRWLDNGCYLATGRPQTDILACVLVTHCGSQTPFVLPAHHVDAYLAKLGSVRPLSVRVDAPKRRA